MGPHVHDPCGAAGHPPQREQDRDTDPEGPSGTNRLLTRHGANYVTEWMAFRQVLQLLPPGGNQVVNVDR